ncbi:MAG: MBL fold metallo-hydrolase [Acidobacteriota bacterium]
MKLVKIIGIIVLLIVLVNGLLLIRFYSGKKEMQANNDKIGKARLMIPEVDSLEIIPVVDSQTSRSDVRTEDGLSYVLRSDHESIIFDVGWNKNNEKESPFIYNLKALGFDLSDFNAMVISHCHPDHVGGMGFREQKVTVGGQTADFPVYTPIPMTFEDTKTIAVGKPSMIGKDFASSGPLAQQMYVPGTVYEQALMINVKGKGLVLVSGCGHPQINTMVEKAEAITGQPVYAVVGGTHLYYTTVESAFWRRIMGSTKVFALGLSRAEVENTVDKLKAQGVQKVYISAHDADQASLKIFESRFVKDFAVIKVGSPINF